MIFRAVVCLWLSLLALSSVLIAPASLAAPQDATSEERPQLQVIIEGLEDQLLTNAKAHLAIYALHQQTVPSVFRVRYLMRQGEQELKTALMPYGYYQTQVSYELLQEDQQWTVRYQVNAGPISTYQTVTVTLLGEADQDTAFTRLIDDLAPTIGDPVIHRDYEAFKSRLRNLAAERGYYDAFFSRSEVAIDSASFGADLTIEFNAGPRYLFGDTLFCCATIGAELLDRFVQYQQGSGFNTRDLLDLQVGLAASDYFNTVEISPLWSEASDKQVPIEVTLTPNKRDRYQIGPGYGTDTGARLTLGFDRRWLNDRGHKLSSVVRLSEVQNTGYISYIIPGRNPARDSYSFNAEVSDRSFEQQRSTLTKASVRDIRHYDRWHRTYELSYQREDFAFGDEPRQRSNFFIPSIEWSLIESTTLEGSRNIIDDGYRISVLLRGAHESLVADTNVISLKVSGKWVHRLNDKWRVLARAEVGALEADNFDLLPPTLRFFSGGDHSVRGYGFQQLGPLNEEGVVVGGRFMTANSLELDYAFQPNWRVAIFTDLGNSMRDWQESLKQTVGIGVRWVSPIGPVRLDIANAIDEPDTPWRIHFTLGPDL